MPRGKTDLIVDDEFKRLVRFMYSNHPFMDLMGVFIDKKFIQFSVN